MTKIIDFSKPVSNIIKEYPEVKDILKSVGFNMIENAVARATMGKVTSINKGAKMKKIPTDKIAEAFSKYGFDVINKED